MSTARSDRSFLARWLPGVHRLRTYERTWLRRDVVAGVTVAAYLIPQVMAYATIAGLPPVTGLWAVIGSFAVYALLGSSPQLSSGPESTTALLTAAAVAPLAVGDPDRYATLAATLALLVGGLCLVAWLLRLGFLADLLSRPVLVGYMAGIAVIMIVGQLSKISGAEVTGDSVIAVTASFLSHIGESDGLTVALSVIMIGLLFLGSRLLPRAPVPLIVVLSAAAAVALLDLEDRGVATVGAVPGGVPTPAMPLANGSDLTLLLLPALGLTVVAYTDTVLTARVFADRHGYQVDPNQELLALGAGNVAAGLLRGFAISSSGSRTVIGDSLGSKSQLHSLVALAATVLVLVVGGDILAGFPSAALGALVVWAAVRLIDAGEFRRLARFRRSELMIALATTAGVLVFDILYGVLVAVCLSLADLLRRVARPHDGVLGRVPGVAGMHDINDYPDASQLPGLVVYRYDAPLFFANAEDFKRRALAAVDSATTPVKWLVLNAEANVQIDLTAIDALDALRTELGRRGVVFALARVKHELEGDLRRSGLLERIGPELIFPTLPTAVAGYERTHRHDPGTSPSAARPAPGSH